MHPPVCLLALSLPAEQVVDSIAECHVDLVIFLSLGLTLPSESDSAAIVLIIVVVDLAIRVKHEKAFLLPVPLISLHQDPLPNDVVVALARNQMVDDLKVMLAFHCQRNRDIWQLTERNACEVRMSLELPVIVGRSCFASTEPLHRINLKQTFDQVSCLLTHLDTSWPLVLQAHDLDEQVSLDIGLKRKAARVHLKENHAQRPQVTPWNSLAIGKHLWGHIQGRPDE